MKNKNISKPILILIIILSIICILSIVVPIISPYKFDEQLRGEELQKPSLSHILGTDSLGRDIFVRLMYATRISLMVGVISSITNMIIGTIYGGISGIVGGKTDWVMMRIVDIFISIPQIIYVICVIMICRNLFSGMNSEIRDIVSILIAIGITYWLKMARTVRAEVLNIKEQNYVKYAIAIGSSKMRILIKHIVPNAIQTILAIVILQIPTAIFTEAFLSFVGIGINAPTPSWGSLIYEGVGMIYSQPQTVIYTSILVIFTMILISILGEYIKNKIIKDNISATE